MRRAVLIATLLGAAAVVVLGLWRSPVWQATLLGLTKAKSVLESVPAVLGEQVAAGSTAKTADVDEEQSHPSGEAEHAHAERPAASESNGSKEEGQQGEAHAENREVVELSPAQVREFGIQLAVAGEGPIGTHLERPAEVKFDGDRVVHVVSRVEGVVSEVAVSEGEIVTKDTVMAVLNSRELAELKANYLAAFERRNLARETFERERRLWEKKISSEKDYLDAKTALAEADIAVRASGQKLKALGFSEEILTTLTTAADADLTKYSILAPISGTIVERHLSLGESVSTEKEAFVVADVATVWVEVTIYPKDLAAVRAGQSVTIDLGDSEPIQGKIAFVTPHVREETRTAIARVITDNAGGRLKPGMFVKAQIEIGKEITAVRIPKSAIQNYENGPVVFVQEEKKFEPRPVKLGLENSQYAEVLSGIEAGETYVAEGAFTLKAQLSKASFGEGHGH